MKLFGLNKGTQKEKGKRVLLSNLLIMGNAGFVSSTVVPAAGPLCHRRKLFFWVEGLLGVRRALY